MSKVHKAYTRGWKHGKGRGREGTVTCGFCGRRVPKYKTFAVTKGFSLNDPVLRQEFGQGRPVPISFSTILACPGCARHRQIVQRKR